MSVANEIAKLHSLRKCGAITDGEFEEQKKVLLATGLPPAVADPSQNVARAPRPRNPERESKAKRLVIWSKVLGWGGLGTAFLVSAIVGVSADSIPLGAFFFVLGIVSAIVGGVLGQVGRGMQGRVM